MTLEDFAEDILMTSQAIEIGSLKGASTISLNIRLMILYFILYIAVYEYILWLKS